MLRRAAMSCTFDVGRRDVAILEFRPQELGCEWHIDDCEGENEA